MDNKDPFLLAEWLVRYKAGQLNEQEQRQVETWIREDDQIRELANQLDDRRQTSEALRLLASFDADAAMTETQRKPRGSFRLVRWTMMAAASVLFALVAGLFLFSPSDRGKLTIDQETRPKEPVRLKTAAGSEWILDTLEEAAVRELLGQQGDGLSTPGTSSAGASSAGMNELIVPARNQYKVMLNDQSMVYLNAGSVLRFPSVFSEGERKVSLIGEGYFEITQDASRPFLVETDHMQVNVLGTRFSVRSYPSETAVMATLVSGKVAVRVKGTGQERILSPGEQARITAGGTGITVEPVDAALAVAWKDGWFQFSDAPFGGVIRELARWHDLELQVSDPETAHIRVSGKMAFNDPLVDLLRKFEKLGDVSFRRDGNKLYVEKAERK